MRRSLSSRQVSLKTHGYLLVAALLVGCDVGPTFVDPNTAGPDFLVQGEYVGAAGQGPQANLGAQVIALGKAQFRAVFLPGGLPGAGWDGRQRIEVSGARSNNLTLFPGSPNSYRAAIYSGGMTGLTSDGVFFFLKRVLRASPTLNALPPPGAKVLFNGSTAEAWLDGKITAEQFLTAGARSIPEFQACSLHLEFRLPFMPESRGQKRGNSGVYLQDRYEIQILDSFGLQPTDTDCSALYDQIAPATNASYAPLTWQTYDIDFAPALFDSSGRKTHNARVTVQHNGMVVLRDAEIKSSTRSGRPERPSPGPLRLQHHRSPVLYRNIWLVEAPAP